MQNLNLVEKMFKNVCQQAHFLQITTKNQKKMYLNKIRNFEINIEYLK